MRRIQFSDFEVDLDLFSLTRDGKPVEIGRRALNLLICLIENHERVVDRDFLRREVWDSATLSESAIPTCIREIRKALQDDASNPRFIEAKRGRGYRFIADVRRNGARKNPSAPSPDQFNFVGRDEELKELKACVRSVSREKRGRVAVVSGEAGIGKTRLLEELTHNLSSGVHAYSATSQVLGETPPFWPWTQIINSALTQTTSPPYRLIENAQALASVFPELRYHLPTANYDLAPPDRHSMFAQWSRTVRSISDDEPVVLIFEDVHRADPDSLKLLYWISDEIKDAPILLIATHRPFPKKGDNENLIAEILRIPASTRLSLGPLSGAAITSLIDPLEPNPAELGRDIKIRTGGNAFFVTHLVRNMDAVRALESNGPVSSTMPLNGREIVSRQLSDLPHPTRSCLAAASVVGDRVSIDLLARLMSLPSSSVLDRLEPAIRTWFIQEDGTNLRFNHSLLREALYQNLRSQTRKNFHLQIAQELIQRGHSDTHSAQISDHLAKALPTSSRVEARKYALKAGREAATRFAFARARMYLQRAIDLSEPRSGPEREEHYDVLIELAQATLYDGDRTTARKILLSTARIAHRARSSKALAACALNLAPDFLTIEVGAWDPVQIHLLEQALSSTPSTSYALRAQLFARLAQAKQWSHSREEIPGLSDKALSAAKQCTDKEALLAALSAKSETYHGPHRAKKRVEYLRELGRVADQAGHVLANLLHYTKLISAYLELGDLRKLELTNEKYRDLSSDLGLPQYRWYPGATDCMLATLRGNLDLADNLANQYRTDAGENPDQNFAQTFACQYILRKMERDESSDALPLAIDFSKKRREVLSWSAAVPWFLWDCRRTLEARESLNMFSMTDVRNMLEEPGGGVGVALISEVTAAVGSKSQAQRMLDLVQPLSRYHASAGYGVAYFGSFSRYAGLLADAIGNAPLAIDLLQRAVHQEARNGAQSWVAYAEVDLHRVLIKSNLSYKSSEHRLKRIAKDPKYRTLKRARRRISALGI